MVLFQDTHKRLESVEMTLKEIAFKFGNFSTNTREVIEMASRVPEEKWSEEFGKRIAELVTVKNKPNYCPKELWAKIGSYKGK